MKLEWNGNGEKSAAHCVLDVLIYLVFQRLTLFVPRSENFFFSKKKMDSAKAKAQMSAPYLETQVPYEIQKEKVENRLNIVKIQT